MNLPAPITPADPQPVLQPAEDDSISLLDLFDVVLEQRWVIASATVVALLIGGAYALIATPVFEANTLIQVEDTKGSPLGNLIGDAGSGLFDVRTPTTAEIEILRSRLVVGQAVSNLQLDLTVTPRYLPVLGRWLASRASTPSEPGFLGMPGYVHGTESLQGVRLEIPRELEGLQFTLRVTEDGYALRGRDGEQLGSGRVGQPLKFRHGGFSGELTVDELTGKPGAEFLVRRDSRLAITERLQRQLKIAEQGRQSGVIRASLEDDDPLMAARILNEIGMLYVRQNVERKSAEAEKSLGFLNSQLPQLREQLEASERRFNQFRQQNSTFDLGNEAKTLLDQVVELKLKLAEAQQKRRELEVRYTPQHPLVKAIADQIREFADQIASLEKRARSFPAVEQDLLRLTRDVKVNNELYTALLNSFQQMRLVKEGKVGNVRIVDVAVVPEMPVKPQRSLVLALSGALGLLGGLGLAFLRNSLQSGLRDAGELEQIGLHVFASIPHSDAQAGLARAMEARAPGLHVLAQTAPDDLAVESLRSLRTALQFAMLEAANNVVVITGATPGVGKSFVSVNFGVVLASGGKRVLLIDADLRKGHLQRYLGLERENGLSEAIAGSRPVSELIHRDILSGLDVLTTGLIPPNPAEVLLSASMAQLLAEVSGHYDMVIVDTPPVLPVADALSVAPLAGTVFLVARAETTTLGEVEEAQRRLAQSGVKIRGVVFNGMNLSKRRYGYGYGYGRYRYKYRAYQYGQYGRTSER